MFPEVQMTQLLFTITTTTAIAAASAAAAAATTITFTTNIPTAVINLFLPCWYDAVHLIGGLPFFPIISCLLGQSRAHVSTPGSFHRVVTGAVTGHSDYVVNCNDTEGRPKNHQ